MLVKIEEANIAGKSSLLSFISEVKNGGQLHGIDCNYLIWYCNEITLLPSILW